jgi:hypothetical protein
MKLIKTDKNVYIKIEDGEEMTLFGGRWNVWGYRWNRNEQRWSTQCCLFIFQDYATVAESELPSRGNDNV